MVATHDENVAKRAARRVRIVDAMLTQMTAPSDDADGRKRASAVAAGTNELSVRAASQLGIGGLEQLPAIFIGDQLYLVIGILRDVDRKQELLGSVIIPKGTARGAARASRGLSAVSL